MPRYFPLILACLLASILILAIAPLWSLFARVGLNYNEGWMALTAQRAITGGALYPTADVFAINNYPPLSFYIFGIAGLLHGDTIIAGRLVSLLGLGCTALLVYLCVRALDAPRWSALLAVLLFLLCTLTLFRAYVGIADPQWVAQAFSAAGLLLLLRQAPARIQAGTLAVACLAMLAGGLIKHNVLALPVGVTIWLFWHDRRTFLQWIGFSILFLAVACAVLYAAYGAALFTDILAHQRVLRLTAYSRRPLVDMLPLIAAACMLARWRGAEPGVRLVLIVAACAFHWGLFQRTGVGIAYNVHFELLVVLSITAGAALAAARHAPFRWLRIRWGFGTVAALVFIPYLACAPYVLFTAAKEVRELPDRERAWASLISQVAATPGPVACEPLAVCYWAGKGMELDFFNYGQRLFNGTPDTALVQALHAHRFSRIVMEHRTLTDGKGARLPSAPLAAINASYRAGPVIADDLVILSPRGMP
jgi:hypothetical protein